MAVIIKMKSVIKPTTKPAVKALAVAPKKAAKAGSKLASKKAVKKVLKKESKVELKTESRKTSSKTKKKTSSKSSSKTSTKTLKTASEWFLYMVECADGRVYTGITTDVERRFVEHSKGGIKGAKALRGKGPLTLVFQQKMLNRSDASIAESAIKKLSKQQKLLLIAKGLYQPLDYNL
jgi:putative endonuclease